MNSVHLVIALVVSFILLLFSILVHALTYLGFNLLAEFPVFWLLHFFIFIVIVPLLVVYKSETGEKLGTFKYSFVMEYAPQWMKMLCSALAVYAVINFGLCLVLLEGATPDIWDGRYVLQNKGTFIRELTMEEYQRKTRYETRLFSGHWLIFYFYPITGYCAYLQKQEEEEVV